MYTLKGRYAALSVFVLFALSHGEPFRQQIRQQQRYNPAVSPLPWHLAPPWEYIVREIILKSVSPSPADADAPHRRPLGASFYGGPVAVYSNDDVNVVLSRGNVYHLLSGHWMLCQEGCVDCEPCVAQRNPSFKWILRRVKRLPASDSPRHDLQLTIMPQAEGHFHASNLWPNSYVYVMSPGEREAFLVDRTHQGSDLNSSASLENSFSRQHHRSKNSRGLKARGSIAARAEIPPRRDDGGEVQGSVGTDEKPGVGEEPFGRNHEFESIPRPERPAARLAEKVATSTTTPTDRDLADVTAREATNRLAPKLFLGIDQRGRKHLVHVVPVDHSSTTTSYPVNSFVPHHLTSTRFTVARSNESISERDGQTYQRIFRKVFDSLNTHRRSIEDFLGSPADNVNERGISPSGDNTEVVGFFRNNRDADRTSVDLEATTRRGFDSAPAASFHAEDDDRRTTYPGFMGGRGHEDAPRAFNRYYARYRDANLAKVLPRTDLDPGRERRRMGVKSASLDNTGQNTPRVNLSILSRSSDNSSAVATPKADSGNGLVRNSAKQIDLNDTSAGRTNAPGNSDSIESGSIMTNRKNEQLFTAGRLASGNANRDFQVLRHPFRIIVTTESPVIPREHETLNRTDTLQITTSRTLVESS